MSVTGKIYAASQRTRINNSGSLLVGTTGNDLADAKCSIDEANGDLKTSGSFTSDSSVSGGFVATDDGGGAGLDYGLIAYSRASKAGISASVLGFSVPLVS